MIYRYNKNGIAKVDYKSKEKAVFDIFNHYSWLSSLGEHESTGDLTKFAALVMSIRIR